jgi:hypothetical protein
MSEPRAAHPLRSAEAAARAELLERRALPALVAPWIAALDAAREAPSPWRSSAGALTPHTTAASHAGAAPAPAALRVTIDDPELGRIALVASAGANGLALEVQAHPALLAALATLRAELVAALGASGLVTATLTLGEAGPALAEPDSEPRRASSAFARRSADDTPPREARRRLRLQG